MMNFFFFGDSICFGQGVSPHRTWVTRISAEIEKRFPGKDLVVVNSSINGNTTRMALDRMAFDVTSHGLAGMLVQFGLNDCNRWTTDKGMPRTTEKAYVSNLNEIIDRGKHFGAKRVLLNTNHPTPRNHHYPHVAATFQEGNLRYNHLIREVASSRSDVELIDVEKHWFETIERKKVPLKDLLLGDELHLSPAGHDLYFELVGPRVFHLIAELI